MESNKENIDERDPTHINRMRFKSKIPIPRDPLPPLSKYLRTSYMDILEEKAGKFQRLPLKTLNDQTGAGPSHVSVTKRKNPGTPLKVDTKFVTVRKSDETLDWDLKLLRDELNDSVVSISDADEDIENVATRIKRKFSLVGSQPVTPCLEPNRVKNIKRSLKRPHSRELMGVSPSATVVLKRDGVERRTSNYKERIFERLRSPDVETQRYMTCIDKDYTHDLFEYSLVFEKKPYGTPRITTITRACVVNWLMKVNGPDGNPAVVQCACWYLDSILAKEEVHLERLQLVATACFWIAQKLIGPSTTAARLVRCANQAFERAELLTAERAILRSLSFPTQPIVSHDFIKYLAWFCDKEHPGVIEVAATFIAMAGLLVNPILACEYPSVIAAAAFRNALLLLGKKELMPRLFTCNIFRTAERKATNFKITCSAQRIAVRTVANSKYEYRIPYEHYGKGPFYIAKKIVRAAGNMAIIDARNTAL